MEIEYSIIGRDEFNKIEELRKDVYKINNNDNSYYYQELLNGNILGIGCYLDNSLIGGIYLSSSLNSLYVENIFIDDKYQNKKIGYSFLKYVLEHKEIADEYFKKDFKICRLDSRYRDSFYENLGFCKEDNIFETMKKRL